MTRSTAGRLRAPALEPCRSVGGILRHLRDERRLSGHRRLGEGAGQTRIEADGALAVGEGIEVETAVGGRAGEGVDTRNGRRCKLSHNLIL